MVARRGALPLLLTGTAGMALLGFGLTGLSGIDGEIRSAADAADAQQRQQSPPQLLYLDVSCPTPPARATPGEV